MSKSVAAAAVAVSMAVALASCGADSGSSSSSSASKDTVAVDVGTGKPVQLKKGKLKVALVILNDADSWTQAVAAATKTQAKSLGWDLDVFSAGLDAQKEQNTLQTILSGRQYDAVATIPTDGTQECKLLTKDLPAANILVSVGDVPLCGNFTKPAAQQWVPGTLSWIGGTGITLDFYKGWFEAIAKAYPGRQQAVLVNGPPQITVSRTESLALKQWQPQHPDFRVTQVRTDFTTSSTYTAVTNYLNAHPDVSVIMSTGAADMVRGIVNALRAKGKLDDVAVLENSGSDYAFQQLEAGTVKGIVPYTPDFMGSQLLEQIHRAQNGQTVERFRSDVPPALGSLSDLQLITKADLKGFKPQY